MVVVLSADWLVGGSPELSFFFHRHLRRQINFLPHVCRREVKSNYNANMPEISLDANRQDIFFAVSCLQYSKLMLLMGYY